MKRERRGWSTTQLADYTRQIARWEGSGIELKQQSFSGFENKPPRKIPDSLRYVNIALEEGVPIEQRDTNLRDKLVYAREIDIRFAMGDGTRLKHYPEVNLVPFNLNFLRRVANALSDRPFDNQGSP